jgi:predicted nucleic acid-binding protein
MPVTDDQVATLRALLGDDMDRYRQLFSGLDRAEAKKGYSALVTAGFVEAVERRFGTSYQDADIVEFVASVRARSDQVAAELDPDVAERVIRVVLEDAPVDDLSRNAITGAQLLLLIGLIADAQLDSQGLDQFLASARKFADQLMG